MSFYSKTDFSIWDVAIITEKNNSNRYIIILQVDWMNLTELYYGSHSISTGWQKMNWTSFETIYSFLAMFEGEQLTQKYNISFTNGANTMEMAKFHRRIRNSVFGKFISSPLKFECEINAHTHTHICFGLMLMKIEYSIVTFNSSRREINNTVDEIKKNWKFCRSTQ